MSSRAFNYMFKLKKGETFGPVQILQKNLIGFSILLFMEKVRNGRTLLKN